MTSESRALNEAETAQRLGVSTATLRNWRRKQVGPKYRQFGRAIRYMAGDVEAYVAENEGHANPPERTQR